MSPTSLSFRSANIPETITPVSKGSEKDMFIISPLSNPIDVLRDVRAYERDRQRAKKAAELVKTRERKERGSIAGRNTWSPWSDKAAVKSGKTSWFRGSMLWDNENEKGDKDQREVERPVTPFQVMSKQDSLDGEVKLADLMTSRKPRKNKEGDFEVIPLPRQVIVLDEFTVYDMDIDEPWEHVDRHDDEKVGGPSYAAVVSTAK